ncbi:hypothetical protein [Cupriavidus numazuensis]|uniref:hypothetical protein n=1 Tax=Cupriavidus numazuensis TaxID=221992 RepID=UPI0031407666
MPALPALAALARGDVNADVRHAAVGALGFATNESVLSTLHQEQLRCSTPAGHRSQMMTTARRRLDGVRAILLRDTCQVQAGPGGATWYFPEHGTTM